MNIMKKALKVLKTPRLCDQRGVTIILVALLMFVFLGIAALAIDLSHLYVVSNELQNAADAGALAGARFLYNDYGTEVNVGANQIAYDAATANKALAETGGAIAVEVNWEAEQNSGTVVDVQRGHWSFSSKTFEANDSTASVDLWNVSTVDLDNNPNFINAVKVVARRQANPAASFFARIFNHENFKLYREAVGYIGFAGTLGPGEADQPIAICKDSILIDEKYSCNVGRMINSGQDTGTNETGGWTDFNQAGDPCNGGTNKPAVDSLVCANGNPDMILLGGPMATNGGDIQTVFDHLETCWIENTGKTKAWNMTLPVVTCPSNNIGTCEEVVGTVNVNLIWILRDENKVDEDAPYEMENPDPEGEDWASSDPVGKARWDSFVTHFNLRTSDNKLALYEIISEDDKTSSGYTKKTLYFLPDCTPHELKGNTGGQNFGVLARIPVLVK